jgi:predicted RNA-binding Zn-ribbon protein involved in translation (DUF1610 family)
MAEIAALGKRACPECGGEMEWNASKQVFACPFCGFVPKEQPKVQGAEWVIQEHDLEKALAVAGNEDRGYGAQTIQVKCQSCQAISVFEPGKVAQRCPFCGSPSIVPYESTRDAITPESLLPVKLGEPQVRDLVKAWYRSLWFAPNRLRLGALTDTLHAIYLPYWTFDARAAADWTAESGDYYYETEYFTDSQGNRQSRQVQRVRWYSTSGSAQHFFDDDLVPGTVGVRMDLLRKVEPFPTENLSPYDPAFVRGWTVERYQVDLRHASDINQQQMDRTMYSICDQQVPGDTHRSLQVETQYAARTFKHILVPVWLVTYTFGSKSFQTVVNGYTGEIAGDRPVSWVKVFFYVILPILIAVGVFLVVQGK